MKKERSFNGIILSEYDYQVQRTDWHYHEHPYFMYLLEGNLYDVNQKRKAICPPGSLLFHNWQEQHYNAKESQDARGFHIEFDRSWFEENQLDVTLWNGSSKLDHPILHQLIGKLYYEFHAGDEFSEIGIESSLLALCESIEGHVRIDRPESPSWLPSLKELLHSDAGTISLKALSLELGIHPVHLSRSAPKYLGMTLSEYMRGLKIKRSLSYLVDENLSLTEVTYLSGFYDQSHFISLFKSYFGMTPNTYKKAITGRNHVNSVLF